MNGDTVEMVELWLTKDDVASPLAVSSMALVLTNETRKSKAKSYAAEDL